MTVYHAYIDTNVGAPTLYIQWEGTGSPLAHRYIYGTAAVLVREWLLGRCPFGVVLDRLEEYPDEVQGPEADTIAAVQWLRKQHQKV